jgi:hypothetical protein
MQTSIALHFVITPIYTAVWKSPRMTANLCCSRSKFDCCQNFQPGHLNKTAHLGSYTETFQSSGRKTDQNCLPRQVYRVLYSARELLNMKLPWYAFFKVTTIIEEEKN